MNEQTLKAISSKKLKTKLKNVLNKVEFSLQPFKNTD